MLKKISEYIIKTVSRNFGWKLFSLIFAIIIWFIVMNVINPTEVQSFAVNITLLNQDKLTEKGFSIMNLEDILSKKVDIKIKSTRPALDELSKNKKEITATIDLQQFDILYPSDIAEPINVSIIPNIPSNYVYNYEIVNFTPGSIVIQLENITELKKEIVVELTGDVMDGYIATQPEINYNSVTVKGPTSELEKVDTVKVETDISDANSDISRSIAPVVYDSDGNVLEGLTLYPQNINLSIGINKYGQIPVEKPVLRGNPKEGFVISSVVCNPEYIEIIGDTSEIAKIKRIALPAIDIEGLEATKIFRFNASDYFEGADIEIESGKKSQISVIVNIAQSVKKEIEISSKNFEVQGNNSEFDVILPDKIFVELTAMDEIFESLDISTIKGIIDIAGLTEGEHTVSVKLELPEGVVAESGASIKINIVAGEKTTLEEDSNTEIDSTSQNGNTDKDENHISENSIVQQSIDSSQKIDNLEKETYLEG